MLAPVIFLLLCIQAVFASNHLGTSSLLTCMDNSQFTASHFDVSYNPDTKQVSFDVTALSTINANVTANVKLIAYGLNVLERNVTLCSLGYATICPLTTGHNDLQGNKTIPDSIAKDIPGVAFTIPDLDARVRVVLYESGTDNVLACVEAVVSNGKTVQTKYAAWPIAAISGLGVITSGVVSVVGHSNTAAHIASNSMSLFVYFQSLAITAMMGVAKIPPIAAAWAQNFVWSLGIIKVGFIQDIANWYIQLTGGTPSDILGVSSSSLSISVQKRSLRWDALAFETLFQRQQLDLHLTLFEKRLSLDSDNFGYSDNFNATLYTTNEKDAEVYLKILILRGVQRVSYLAGIEITSFFMTGIIFLLFFGFVMVVFLMLFKAVIEICIRLKILNEGKFNEYRQQWSLIIKGALYRLLIIAYPQITVLCFYEFTGNDSAGTIVVAVFLLAILTILLFQAAVRVFLLGRKSVQQFKNPAYLLFGDGAFLNKFGFVYVQYRADHYYFVLVGLVYTLLKSLFVAVLQKHGTAASVIVFAIELFYLIILCWFRPFMDKRTNIFNITIAVISTINALFFMFFSYIFKQPHVIASVMAVVYFVLNAVFALFLLIFTIVTCVIALLYKNPDTRYQPMKDDRVSFLPRFDHPDGAHHALKNQDDMELMALGATAMKGHENVGRNYESDSVYDSDLFRANPYNNTFNDSLQDSLIQKRDSFTDNIKPTEPLSTITGNGNNAMNSYRNRQYQNQSSGRQVNFR